MKIIRKNFTKLSSVDLDKLKKLTLNCESSGMNRAIHDTKNNLESYLTVYKRSWAFILVDDKNGNEWVGWCLGRTYHPNYRVTNIYMLFVSHKYRRKGFGKNLLKTATNYFKSNEMKHECCPWSQESMQFFKAASRDVSLYSQYSNSKILETTKNTYREHDYE